MASLLASSFLIGPDKFVCVVVVAALVMAMAAARRPHRRCNRCHLINRPPARYCAHCGARLNVP